MAQTKQLCTDTHICHSCKKPAQCETYTWACPWRNEDEDQMCDSCMTEFAKSYQEFIDAQGIQ